MLFRFLVHLVGDIHQPLHSVSLWNHQFPNGDQGGNRFIVSFQNMTNLHAVWDSGIEIFFFYFHYLLTLFLCFQC